MKYRILLIEDNKFDQMAFKRSVREDSLEYDYIIAGSVSEAQKILFAHDFHAVITDYRLGDGTAFDIFEIIGDTPVIVVTGGGDEGVAVKAMKAGAYDYLVKDPDLNYLRMLPITVAKAIRRKEAEERLRLLESAVVNANDAIIIMKEEAANLHERRIVYVNEAFTRMTGYSFSEVADKSLKIFGGPKSDQETLEKIHDSLNKRQPVRVEIINYRKDMTDFWVECNIVPVMNGNGEFSHWVSIQRDITGRKDAEEELREKEGRLEYLAHHDNLTGLPNRLFFNKRLKEEIARAGRNNRMLAVMFLDLDNFKNINDTLGHNMGDALLKEVAERISTRLRISDIVSRWGGDEFTILLPEINCPEDVEKISEKIIRAIQEPFDLDGHMLNITTSLGAAIFPGDGNNVGILLKNADIALYSAKYQGKNDYQLYQNAV